MIFSKNLQVIVLFSFLAVFYFAVPANTFYSKYGTDRSEMGNVNDLAYITSLVESDEQLIREKEEKANLGEKLAANLFGVVHQGMSAKQKNGKTGYEMLSQPVTGIVSDFSDTISNGNTDPKAKEILNQLGSEKLETQNIKILDTAMINSEITPK